MSPRVVAEAERWIGTPYRHQASMRGAGCDCLGLIRGVWRALYGREAGPMPPYSADWRDFGADTALVDAAERYLVAAGPKPAAGQVVLLRLMRNAPPRHCAIMIAPDRFVHAQEHAGVVVAEMSEAWARRVTGLYRFPEL